MQLPRADTCALELDDPRPRRLRRSAHQWPSRARAAWLIATTTTPPHRTPEPARPAESVTAQDVVGAVAELLAAAAQVGAIPTCPVSGNVDGEAAVVTVSAWEGDVTGPTIASATAGIG